ncbi:MAG: leucyl aminopeptidase family protein, partial [Actinomycetota bacterium]
MPPQISLSEEAVDHVSCDALVIGVSSDGNGISLAGRDAAVDASMDGQVSAYLREVDFKAKLGEVAIVPTLGRLPAREIAVVGLGDSSEPSAATLRRAAGAAVRRLSERSVVASTMHAAVDPEAGTEAAAEGFLLGSYRFTAYKSDPHPSKIQHVYLLGKGSDGALERAHAASEATALARDLTNEPASTLTPDALARRAREIADVNGLECTTLDERELEAKGFGGLITVGKGSDEPPRLIRLRYAPQGARGKVAIVGKGVTYDSGGLSIKDAKSMETMKTDMAGAAAVVGAMSALGRLGARIEVHAYLPSTENMPGPSAIKPGDVIKHYGG